MNFTPGGITIIGDQTVHRGLCSPIGIERAAPWFRDLGTSPLLDEFGIRHLGVVNAAAPYRFERKKLPSPVFLACVAGSGRVKTGAKWIDLTPGTATLLPGGGSCAYHAVEGVRWKMVWVCFGTDALVPEVPFTGRQEFSVLPLFHAVECLVEECRGAGDPFNLRQTLGLVERMVNRFTSPKPELGRFYAAWVKVERNLGADWKLGSIARLAACSPEQFRRICQREFGTSPKRHLTDLRLRRARQRLLASHDTVETIALEVGYGDAWAFSNVFKKRLGLSPTELRKAAAIA